MEHWSSIGLSLQFPTALLNCSTDHKPRPQSICSQRTASYRNPRSSSRKLWKIAKRAMSCRSTASQQHKHAIRSTLRSRFNPTSRSEKGKHKENELKKIWVPRKRSWDERWGVGEEERRWCAAIYRAERKDGGRGQEAARGWWKRLRTWMDPNGERMCRRGYRTPPDELTAARASLWLSDEPTLG